MTHWCVVQLGTPDRTKFYRGTWTKVKIKRLILNCWCLLVPRPVTAGHLRDSQSCESITMEMDCLCPVMLWGLQGWASLQRTFVFVWRLWTFDRTAPHYSPHTPLVSWGVFQVLVDKTPKNYSDWNSRQQSKISSQKQTCWKIWNMLYWP